MTTVRRERLSMPMSRLGPPSNLPRLSLAAADAQQADAAQFRSDRTREPPWLQLGRGLHPALPGVGRLRPRPAARHADVLVLENGRLKAVVAPRSAAGCSAQGPGDRPRPGVSHPVFQPANLAALNAWFSGGIEWNGLIPGHTPFTCAPVFAGVRETPQGPILRIYEFDRIVEATWQVDLFMPADAAQLVAHGRIVNPNDGQRLAYWWTNVAAPMSAGRVSSVLPNTPSNTSGQGNNLGRCDFPRADWDPS